ncbi:YebC/PmpR family DNA-binding transcriptional regulator, partial [Patescibacteria group bacterium]|nr:YebC/PmpR family DNA-binding transcriptional regulator [Patescibacteria group bacterium]
MSGHSKWSKLKHSKGALDAKRGTMFTKLGNVITIAAREGGGDLDSNFKLRLAIENAKKANLPKDNIERAIKRGTGELAGGQIEEVIYEAFGPDKTSFIVEALTDNKNRTVASLRRIFNKHGGSLAGQNSVCWMFEKRGILRITDCRLKIDDLEKFQLEAIDLGVEDIKK